ncbi:MULTISPECIES: transposase family protein [Thermoanaerobacter]|nr:MULTISPECIES: transposase family protein [Thermoanaerobacter]UZQ84352.1 transposase family protein [Thermoanaerobacter sp. RKWS2]
MKQKPHTCPRCGKLTSKVHDYRTQRIKDIPLWGKKNFLLCPEKEGL